MEVFSRVRAVQDRYDDRFKALRCTISRGGFSDERVFTLSSGYVGLASRQYVWHDDGRPLGEGEPPIGQTVGGMVAARVVEIRDDGQALVSLPDGSAMELLPSALIDRPSKVGEHVSVGS